MAIVVVSFLLFLLAVVVWVRSSGEDETVIWRRARGDCWIAGACAGQVLVGHSLYPGIDPIPRPRPTGLFFSIAVMPRQSYSTGWPLDPCRTRSGGGSYPLPFRVNADYDASYTYFDTHGFAYQEGLFRWVDQRERPLATAVSSRILLLPCWSICVAFGIVPVLWTARQFLRRRRSRPRTGFELSLPGPDAAPCEPEDTKQDIAGFS
jgi:hypothetical protein